MTNKVTVLENSQAGVLDLRPKMDQHPLYRLGIGHLLFSLTSVTDREGDIHGVFTDHWRENIAALSGIGVPQLELIKPRRLSQAPIYLDEGYRLEIGGWLKSTDAESADGGVDGIKVYNGNRIVKDVVHPSVNILVRHDPEIASFHAEIAMLGGVAVVRQTDNSHPIIVEERTL